MARGPAIPLAGGLDLVSPAPMARPGTLADCENYEVSTRSGYSRVGGFERFDGRPGVAEFRLLQLTAASISGSISVRDRVIFVADTPAQEHQNIDGYVVSITASGSEFVLCVAFLGGMADPTLPDTLQCPDTGSTAQITAYASLRVPVGQQQHYDYALRELATLRRAQIEAVPGNPGSDVLGGFLFRNREYAIRDLPRVYFEGGYYTDADEGGYITVDSQFHEILEVRVLGDNAGFVAYNPVASGTGTPAAAGFGTPTLTSLPVTGSLSGGFVGIPYSDSLSASGGTPPYFWSLADSGATAPAPSEISDLSEVTLQSEVTPAALWRATDEGWELVELQREMAFSGGTGDLRATPRALTLDAGDLKETAWQTAGVAEIDGVAASNLAAEDGTTDALGTGTGQTLWCRDFDFSDIPVDAQILGIEVTVKRQADVGGKARDNTVILTGVFGGTENKAQNTAWPTVLTSQVYGGESDKWGSENITRDTLLDPSFGVLVVVEAIDSPVAAEVDYVAIRVHYAERGGIPAYVWDGSTDIPIRIIGVQVLSGDLGVSSGAGYLTLEADKNISKSRLIGVGEQVRSAPSGGGDLLCLTASRDRPIFLPGQSEIDNNRSMYIWDQYNFFAQDRYAAMYGVSGAGPAMSFDGETLIKIRTPLPPGVDVPRQIAKHGTMLMLGFFSGAVIASAVGDPYEMRGAFGAAAIEVGDRLTGLAPAGGDAMLIVCESSTYVLRGLSPVVFSQNTVSATRGAIEYTLADPGRAIIADSFGLFAADTPESFEPAARAYLSTPVQPWLRERLQATISNEQRFLRPVCALAVRSKNQYRLYFRDGAVLTMTLAADGIEITKQRLYDMPGRTAIAVRNIWSGIDASGRERIFCSFRGAKEGYVFEADVGRSFDGGEIPAFFVVNAFYAGAMSQLKHFDRAMFGGVGGVADLDITFGINNQMPAGDPREAQLGAPTLPAVADNASDRNDKMGSFEMGIEAYNVLLRVDSLTDLEAPHTLQYIETFIDSRGDTRGHRGDS